MKPWKDYDRVFIDCGGHKGESARKAKKIFGNDILVISFEPNDKLHQYYETEDLAENFVLLPFGVAAADQTITFYDNVGGTQCFTAVTEMLTDAAGILGEKSVSCIDVGQWIKDHFVKEQKISLKLDIEGMEYLVLPKLLDSGVFAEYIDELFIDFHAHRMFKDIRNFRASTYDEFFRVAFNCEQSNLALLSMHNELLFRLFSFTKNVFHWDALIGDETLKKPVYYLTYDLTRHCFDRKTVKL